MRRSLLLPLVTLLSRHLSRPSKPLRPPPRV
jgi:hypothetical protein